MWPHRGSAPYYNHSGRGLSDIRGGQWKINNDINKDEWEQLIGQFSCTAAGSFKHRTTITFFILEPQTISLNVSLNWRTRTTSVNADELVKTQWNCPQNSKELLRNFTMIYILTLELSLNWILDLDTELLEHRQDPSLKLFGVFALKPLENWRAEAGRTCGTSWMNRIPQQNIWSTVSAHLSAPGPAFSWQLLPACWLASHLRNRKWTFGSGTGWWGAGSEGSPRGNTESTFTDWASPPAHWGSTPSHLLGGLVPQLGGDPSERFPIGSSLLTGCQDGAVRLTETGSAGMSVWLQKSI